MSNPEYCNCFEQCDTAKVLADFNENYCLNSNCKHHITYPLRNLTKHFTQTIQNVTGNYDVRYGTNFNEVE